MAKKEVMSKVSKNAKTQNIKKRKTVFMLRLKLGGDASIRGHKLPKAMLVGIIGVVFMYAGVAGIVSATTPWWLGRGDAPRHIDYAFSIYNGQIPKFSDPLRFSKFKELPNGKRYKNQPAAINPPLFYLLHAPIVGPLLDGGHWKEAIALGRVFNIFLGILCIGVLAWGGWIFGGRRKALFAVAVPALAVLVHNFTSLNQNYANDVLLILFTTLSFISSYKIIKYGLKKNYLAWLALLSFLGMSTKATYIVFLFTNLLAVVIASVLHGKEGLKNDAIKGAFVSGAIFALVLFTIGWYYLLQNFLVSGNWVSAAPKTYGSGGRPYKSLEYVLTSSNLWGMLYEKIAATKTVSTTITIFATGGIAFIYVKDRFKQLFKDKVLLISAALMVVATAGIFMTQIVHAVGYGGFYFRYFLPLLLPLGIVLSYGLLGFKWFKGQLITLASTSMGLSSIVGLMKGNLGSLYTDVVKNGVPTILLNLMFLTFVVGSAFLSWSLYTLTNEKRIWSD